MNLRAGCRFAVAPKFHLSADWVARLTIGAGVEESDGRIFPRGPWRAPTAEELDLLVARAPTTAPGALPLLDDPAAPARAGALDEHIGLFQIPEHLREAWWKMVESSAESGGPVKGFDEFAARVTDFLTFKGLAGAGTTQMEVLVTAPGERSLRVDSATGRPGGLGSTVAPWSAWPVAAGSGPRLRAIINLGDERTGVVLFNLNLSALAAELARRAPTESPLATVGELVARFGALGRDYPPVRVQLGAGEGCRFPADGLILDGDATDKEEPAVTLLISEE